MFDTSEENTFAVTISLAEYRDLVAFQATQGYRMNEMQSYIEELEKRNTDLINQVMVLQEAVTEDSEDES